MPEMTEPTLTIIFAWNPGARMLQATLPNGAQFWVDTLHVNGKLGENLGFDKVGNAFGNGPVHGAQ